MGSHGVGKTTLLNALRSEPFFEHYYIGNEVTRELKDVVPINEAGTKLTQQLIMHKHAYNVLLHDDLLIDRTPLDCYVYSEYLLDQNRKMEDYSNGITTSFMHFQYDDMTKMLALFDYLFYIEPEFELRGDEVRSINPVFSIEIRKKFKDAVRAFRGTELIYDTKKHEHVKLPITTLSGSVRERVNQVLATVGALEIPYKEEENGTK